MSVDRERSPTEQVQANGIRVDFGGVRALADVDFELARAEIRGLIGPNGAGKTTLLNVLTGFLRPDAGAILLDGVSVSHASPRDLARRGVVRTFQDVRLFGDFTVLENVMMSGLGRGLSRAAATSRAREVIELLELDSIVGRRASVLPHGDARRVGVARAVASYPRYLLLDEPGAGLNDEEKRQLGDTIISIRNRYHCGVLLVDHDMTLVMNVCEAIHVLDFGRTIAVGAPADIRADPGVIEAYLGPGDAAGERQDGRDDAER